MVRELLDDLARDVPDYSNPDRALAAARASRRRRTGGGAALVATALALAAAVTWAPVGGPGPDWPPFPGRSEPVLASAPMLADLPTAAVGPARLAYRLNCRTPCSRMVLQMEWGGLEYSLDHLGDLGVPSLSPNGELLVAPFSGDGGYKVRDLRSDEPPTPFEPRLGAGLWSPMTWSPDNRWLVMWGPRGNGRSEYARVDLRDLTIVTYQPPADLYACAVLPSGELLLAPSTAWTEQQPLQLADPATGDVRPLLTVDSRAMLQPGLSIQHDPTSPALLSTDGMLGLIVRNADRRALALLEFNLASGALIDAKSIPYEMGWEPVAYGGTGLHMVTRKPVRAGVLAPDGHSVTTPELPAPTQVLVPGGRTWY
ncbi:hypothetical protein [Virgisporangium aurantiacum]|uniref:WD40-like Beta Propeller Repeat n=1 Tax=Virgisporangium aurantiacum TaxID=175570 RepID=A0A8J4DZ76_9ACTN|nr:hypothetical protein [Virgisporangium aurantiacum]GIJ53772.1 hypothetical protein Vau01_012880 [Virgisporangium aurantiacum]